jgi:hypothetical protein
VDDLLQRIGLGINAEYTAAAEANT